MALRIIAPQASFCIGDGKCDAAIHFRQKTVCNEYVFWYSEDALVTQTTAQTMDTAAQGLLSRDEMESRRLLAAQDLQTGLTQSEVARKFGVSRTTASRWNRSLSGKGVESLRKRPAPGRPSRLTAHPLLIPPAPCQSHRPSP